MTLATVPNGNVTKEGGKELVYRCTLCGTEHSNYPIDGKCEVCGSSWKQTRL